MASSVNFGTQQYFGFDPRTIAGCRLWLDAADSNVVIRSGTNVTQWNDKSGNGFNFSQATTARQPIYTTNSLNGLNAITFSGVGVQNSTTQFLDNASFTLNNLSYSIFIVARQNASAPSYTGYNCILKGNILSDFSLFFGNNASKNFATFTGTSAAAPITPSSITGLRIWNDASTLTQADGTALTTWPNAGSGGTVNCTGTVVTGGLNGLRVVRFTTSQIWSTVTAINLASHSFFFVSRQRGGANGRVWTGTNNQLYGYWGGYKRSLYIDANPGFLTTAPSDTTWDMFSFTRTASGPYAFKWQGNTIFSGSTSTSANMVGLFINSGAFVEPSDCEIAEVILYDSVLTADQVAGIESYLTSKWGVGTPGGWNDTAGNTPAITTTNNPLLMEMTVSNAVLTPYYNGITQNTKTGTTGVFAGMRIGDSANGFLGQNWNGIISEICIYNNVLSTRDRQQVEGYLSWKWGVRTYTGIVSPTAITGCQLWLDAADPNGNGTIPTNGSTIASWVDKTINGRNATGIDAPTYSSSNIVFNGSSYFNINLDFLAGVSHTAFIVIQPTFFTNIYGAATGSSGSNSLHVGFENNGIRYRMNYWGNDYGPDFVNYKPSQYNFLQFYWENNASKTVFANGFLEGTTNQAGIIGTMAGGGRIGNVVGQGIIQANIREIVFYTSSTGNPLTDDQRQRVEGYLAWKWGLQSNLPPNHPYNSQFALTIGHPYKSVQPIMRIFQPIDIVQPEYWFDAADRSTITTSGGPFLASWRNKGTTGGGGDVIVNAGSPTTGVATQNGQNCIAIPAGASLSFSSIFPIQDRTRFIASRPTVNTITNRIVFMFQQNIGNAGNDYLGLEISSGAVEVAQGQIVTLQTAAVPQQQNVFTMYTFRNAVAAGRNRVAYNGNSQALTSSTDAQQYRLSSVTAFINIQSANQSAQDMGEFLSYNRELTESETHQVEGYLAWKWGLQANLPITHPYYRVLPSTPLFVPSQLSGLQLWLDAADSSTISTSGTSVTQWRDKSGNSRHGNTGVSPVYSGDGIVFSGGQYLFVANASGLFTNTSFNIFIVEKVATDGAGYLLGDDVVNGGVTNASLHIGYRTNANLTFAFWANDLEITGLSGNPTRIWSFNMPASANRNALLNGSLVGTLGNSSKLTTMTTLTLGRVFGGGYYNGRIYEVIGYVGEITTSQRQAVEGYLAWKWGLQDKLPVSPVTHPYYKFRA